MFFVREKGPAPQGFLEAVEEVERAVREMTRSELAKAYERLSTRSVRVEPVGPGLYAVYSEDLYESVRRSYLSPSLFVSYRACARAVAIEVMEVAEKGRVVVSLDDLRHVVKGLLVHGVYYERFAVGETEVPVVSNRERIYGVVDELRVYGGSAQVYEVKSGAKPDLVGAGLQVMAYVIAASDTLGLSVESIEGYIVTPLRTYSVTLDQAVFAEYRKRVEKVVEHALSGRVDILPPRLPSNLSHRCSTCVYRGRCASLPDRFRTYERYFREMGFEKLAPRKPKSKPLSSYFKSNGLNLPSNN